MSDSWKEEQAGGEWSPEVSGEIVHACMQQEKDLTEVPWWKEY